MGSNAELEVPTTTKIPQTQYEEDGEDDEVGDLERKAPSLRREKRTISTDSSTITVTTSGSSSSSSSSSDGTDSFCADVPNVKELSVDQSDSVAAENSPAPELPEQDKELGFHGEHSDEKNGSVYFDGEQGIWKCHHCDWTCREESVLWFESKGLESNGASGAETDALEFQADEKLNPDAENGLIAEVNEPSREIEEIGTSDSSEVPKVGGQLDEDVIEDEVDIEADDYGVEKVLENQETHDLYCPNCNSCITKRVVLKRRKRKIRHVLGDAKRERLDITPEDPMRSGDNEPPAQDPVDVPYLLRCLSCFSIFLPSGECFKRFPSTKEVKENETPLLSQHLPAAADKPNWFLSLFGHKKKETALEEGGVRGTAPQVDPQDKLHASLDAREDVHGGATTSTQGGEAASGSGVNLPPSSEKNGTASDVNEQLETGVPVQHVDTAFTRDQKQVDTESNDTTLKSVDDGVEATGLGFLAALAGKDENLSSGNKPSDKVSLWPIPPYEKMEESGNVTVGHVEINIDPKLPMIEGSKPIDSWTAKSDSSATNDNDTGGNLEIVSDHGGDLETEHPENRNDNLTDALLGDKNLTPSSRVEVGDGHKLEILKSIVYGGLIESITSLGVISSAAGSGASTLNILVLGLANLVGGLILIVHNLQELREDNTRTTETDGNQIDEQEQDRYKRLLGRRENFRLHATVAILSFIIVGLIPPAVYGFSFRKSDNRDYKAVSVLAASLVCVILLAIAKAHVKTPRGSYLKSVLYYTTIAISASSVSFFVGNIVSEWLEKYGWSDGSENPAQLKLMLPLLGRKGGFDRSSY
ncbi:PREDICTED: membrane protein of ER body-like protein [Tarenaya hassleriana]|uniref:membrane protein of ER body-like protein n=1 Tax=Tarenaya hassleriana TaxID=28532 RepID=UPI00053C18CE|nr:PREDICTED: membrane protein of ER body-like protein [Tarenaya hassleriana]